MVSRYLRILLLLAGASSLGGQSIGDTTFGPSCSTRNNYTIADPYQVNLARLTANLPQGALNNRGFNTSTGGEAPDMVYGLTMCYADHTLAQCKSCLEGAAAGIEQVCPGSRMATATYPACFLRYSNESFFFVADLIPSWYTFDNSSNPKANMYVADMSSMNNTRWELMSQLAGDAPGSPLRLANGSQAYTDSRGQPHVMYGLAQCTRDLNATECSRCLTVFVGELFESKLLLFPGGVSNLFRNNTYGAIKAYSCYVAYSVDRELGIAIMPSQGDSPPSPTPPPPTGGGGISTTVMVTAVTVCTVVVTICVSLRVYVFFRRRRRRAMARKQELDSFDEQPLDEEEFEKGSAGPRRFSYNELAAATKHFSNEEKLGEGGFGSVYHGYLKDADLHVAIKRISKTSQQGKKEYAAEVKIISRLRHRNLVQLIGWCHGGGELLLVYELMPNGSLDTHIHSEKNTLQWPLRHEIVLGVGSALVYLHQDWEQCVLHRDIKPSNLMLDASFKVKLGDFGLARLVNHGQGSHTTMIAGTMGYMDPAECMVTGRASTESDIYSFGVVVLEIVCGRLPILVFRGNEENNMHLVQWVWELYGDGRILDAADVRLNGEFDSQQMVRVMVAALWCAHPDMKMRPSIREALNVMRLEAPLPSLPTKMPVATFMSPVGVSLSKLVHDVTGRSGKTMSTMQTSTEATTSSFVSS